MMKLHVYDHCPFCVRARMPFGLKGIPFELHVQHNDDEATPIAMIGRKMLPILEDADGYTGESLDIVAKVDGMNGARLFDGPARPEITDWIGRWNPTIDALVIPRTPVPVYPEFGTASARAYFTSKKEPVFGDFDELLSKTDALIDSVETGLEELVPILPDAEQGSIDDILLFPVLRSLSVLREVRLPPQVAAYRDRMAERSDIPLFEDLRLAAE